MAIQVGKSVYDTVHLIKARFADRGYPPPYYLYINREIEFFDPDVIVIVDSDKDPITVHILAKPIDKNFEVATIRSRLETYFGLHTLLVEKLATWLNKLLRRVG